MIFEELEEKSAIEIMGGMLDVSGYNVCIHNK